MRSNLLGIALLVAVFSVSACAHKAKSDDNAAAQPAATSNSAAKPAQPAPVAEAAQSCRTDDDCPAKSLCIRGACVVISPALELAECSLLRVHFDYDAWILRADDKPRLDRVARCLRADHKLHVTIEGNADERGTEEYNLQLGSKRATQVEKYLEALGVVDAQLKTISYGFENPLCTEHDEACWSQNRRAGVKAQAASH
jgi:peptidoglycan-associated lipoprotein